MERKIFVSKHKVGENSDKLLTPVDHEGEAPTAMVAGCREDNEKVRPEQRVLREA